MKIVTGDLWDFNGWRIVPTNLSYNNLGNAVTGRGVALQAAMEYPGLRRALGKKLRETNRAPYVHVFGEFGIICLPVKRRWNDGASMAMIRSGLQRLNELADELEPSIYLPLLGCGFGELTEAQVLPVLESFLDDRFVLVKRGRYVTEKYPRSFAPSIRSDRSLGELDGR